MVEVEAEETAMRILRQTVHIEVVEEAEVEGQEVEVAVTTITTFQTPQEDRLGPVSVHASPILGQMYKKTPLLKLEKTIQLHLLTCNLSHGNNR